MIFLSHIQFSYWFINALIISRFVHSSTGGKRVVKIKYLSYLFIQSFICLSIHSYIHSFMHSLRWSYSLLRGWFTHAQTVDVSGDSHLRVHTLRHCGAITPCQTSNQLSAPTQDWPQIKDGKCGKKSPSVNSASPSSRPLASYPTMPWVSSSEPSPPTQVSHCPELHQVMFGSRPVILDSVSACSVHPAKVVTEEEDNLRHCTLLSCFMLEHRQNQSNLALSLGLEQCFY